MKNWWIDSDNLVTFDGLTNRLSGAYINDATVSGQVTDKAGAAVGGAVTLNYVAASDGQYKGTIPKASMAGVTEGNHYIFTIIVTKGTSTSTVKVVLRAGYKTYTRVMV